MSQLVQLTLLPEEALNDSLIKSRLASIAKVDEASISDIRILKRSVDARQREVKVILSLEFFLDGERARTEVEPFHANDVSQRPEVIIIGAGPAGLFAALRLIELNVRPIILERGKDVSERKRDIALISREHRIDPDSNYCHGAGGAGTFSDGKLYTRSKKRGNNSRILELLTLHGANNNILYEAHPHLGTDKLPKIISNIITTIKDSGGEVLFGKRVTRFIIDGSRIEGVVVNDSESYRADNVILATGHSATDMYVMCHSQGVRMELKPFAMGVRVEHPQELIDNIQYHGNRRGEQLPAASYNIVKQVDGRGVYSFCMCPGGFIVPAATSADEIVVNGMSPSQRNSPYANAGIVVEIRPEDIPHITTEGVMAGLNYRRELETMAWQQGGSTQRAPMQRLSDFVHGHFSNNLPKVSYLPGVTPSSIHEWLPSGISDRLRKGFKMFDSSMRGFVTWEAVVAGVESRSSSPLRIPRDPSSMEHVEISGLYPCGEGAGYAGGIVSAAIDGTRVAEAIVNKEVSSM